MSTLSIGLGLRQVRSSLLAATRGEFAAKNARSSSCALCGQCQGGSGSTVILRQPLSRSQSTSIHSSKPAQAASDHNNTGPSQRGAGETADSASTSSKVTDASPDSDKGKGRQPSPTSQIDILRELEAWASARAKLAIRHPSLNGPQLSLLAHITAALDRARRAQKLPPPAELVRLHDELLESPPHGQTCEPSATTFALLLRYAYRQGDAATLRSLSYHATKWYQADARAGVAPSSAASGGSTSDSQGVQPEVDLLTLIHNLGMAHRTRGGRRTLSIRMLRVREASLQERRRQASLANQDLQMRFAYHQLLNPRGLPVYREGKVAAGFKDVAAAAAARASQEDDDLAASPFETDVVSKSALARTRYGRLHTARSKLKLMRHLARSGGSRMTRSASRVPVASAQGRASIAPGLAGTGPSDELLKRWRSRLDVRDRRRSAAENEVREMIVRMRTEAGENPIGVPTWLLLSALRRRAEQGLPKEAKSLVAAYMASLRDAGRVEGKTLPNPQRVFAVSKPDMAPAGSSLLNLVLRAHLTAGHPVEPMLETVEQMTGKKGFKGKVLSRVLGEARGEGRRSAAAAVKNLQGGAASKQAQRGVAHATREAPRSGDAVFAMDVNERSDWDSFEYRVTPNETTILLLLAGLRTRKQRVLLGTSIVRQAMYTWMPSGKGATRASSASAPASRPLELTTATARTLLGWALRERKGSTKLARGVLTLHKRYRELEGMRARHLSTEHSARSKLAPGGPSNERPRRGGEASKWRRVLFRAMEAKVISRSHFSNIC